MSAIGTHSSWYHRLYRAPEFPDQLRQVTSIDAGEVHPGEAGMTGRAVADIWNSVKSLYQTNMHPAVAICLRRQGKLVLNRTIGYASGLDADEPQAPTPISLDTPICLFSASKAISAMVVHKLAEDGFVDLLNPVSYYLPEFAQHGKGNITLYQLLAHRGGVPQIEGDWEPEDLLDSALILKRIYASQASCTKGRVPQYHSLTGGYLIDALVRETTGRSLREYFDGAFRQPLGMRCFDYGVSGQGIGQAARNYVTGLSPGRFIGGAMERILGVDADTVTGLTNDPRFLSAVLPSANLYATAEEACRFYQMLLDNGRYGQHQVLKPMTVFRATQESRQMGIDQLLKLPMRYSSGFMLGEQPIGLYGPQSHYAFGHAGFTNILCWADPERDISAALLTTGKPLLGPQLLQLPRLVMAVANGCERIRDFSGSDLLYRNTALRPS